MTRRPFRISCRVAAFALPLLALIARPRAAGATPYDYIPVGDPIESELRILDLYPSESLNNRLRLPHLGIRPWQAIELQGPGRSPDTLDLVRRISAARIERALGRDRAPFFAPDPELHSTRRLYESRIDRTFFEVSVGAEGRAEREEGDESRIASGTGLHGRVALGLDRLLAFTHYIAGRIDNARRFADPIVPNHDIILITEDTYIAYADEDGQWGTQFGKTRWHWGPGEEGSLLLSKTSPALTGLSFHARHDALRADGVALSATLESAAGEQLAAHRIEWQLSDGLRVGVTESARYKATGWQPLYLIGIIPYVLVQRLEMQAEPDSLSSHRNNVMTSFDAAWRVAEGTKIYGEFLIDDLHARSGSIPNKFGYQLGWEGAGTVADRRLTWGGEYTRVSRYVYTSFFGRDYVVQGKPLGFPTGPDVRRVRLRTYLDLNLDWSVFARVTHNDKGENDISEPFIPGSGRVEASHFEGIVETTRELELGLRYWPASGVYVAVSGGYRWINNRNHVEGDRHNAGVGAIEVRINR
jgi:hypothetical protein